MRRSEYILLCKRQVSLEDVQYRLSTVINDCNRIGGPQVLFCSEKQCFGLFADRDYEKGERVTTYGGVITLHECCGDYAAQIGPVHVNGLYGFELQEKGRWINEFNAQRTLVNVELGRTVRTTQIVLKGQEFFGDYGDEYVRNY